MSARFSLNQRNTGGHRPPLQLGSVTLRPLICISGINVISQRYYLERRPVMSANQTANREREVHVQSGELMLVLILGLLLGDVALIVSRTVTGPLLAVCI